MSSKLPLKLDDLLRQRMVEGDGLEFKAGWNRDRVMKTGCPFARNCFLSCLRGGGLKQRLREPGRRLRFHPLMPGVGQAHEEAHDVVHDEIHDEVHDEVLNETEQRVLAALVPGPQSRAEMAETLGMKSTRSGHLARAMERLRRLGLAELTLPDKPQSKNQKMRITATGRAWLAGQGKPQAN